MSSQRNDLCRSRRARTARHAFPALPVSSGCPLLANLRNRLGLWLLRDLTIPDRFILSDESCGPGSPTEGRWCNLRKSLSAHADDLTVRPRGASLISGECRPAGWGSGCVSARHAIPASCTDVGFLSISDHGRIDARPNSRQSTQSPDAPALRRVNAVASRSRAVFHSKETGNNT